MVKFFKHALFIMLVTVFANTAAFAGCVNSSEFEKKGFFTIAEFATDKTTLSDDCINDIKSLANTLNQDKENIKALAYIGQADAQGGPNQHNNELSQKRALYVRNQMSNLDIDSGSISIYAAGNADATTFYASGPRDNQQLRSVRIYVLWEHDACTTQLRDLIKTAELKVAELKKAASNSQHLSKVEAELNGIVNYCKDGNEYLTHSQRVKIDEVLNDCMKLLGIKFDTTLLLSSEITMAHANLMALLKSLSVWRDSEGNFNKARLASDALALVTLGTVGGVITSTLVKKNQIKKGFEAIQCSIGGNIVANYGDEFVVGPVR